MNDQEKDKKNEQCEENFEAMKMSNKVTKTLVSSDEKDGSNP